MAFQDDIDGPPQKIGMPRKNSLEVILFFVKFIYKNVWTSDKSWEPGMFLKTWKPENFENIKNDLWDMLNNFCFHVYAQKSLFIGQNVNVFFLPPCHPLTLEFI